VEAVVGKYEGKINEIDGNRAKTDVFSDICGVIDEM
jgi:adenylate kinase